MKNLSTYILVSTFILASCGGGGGGGSAPSAPAPQNISVSLTASADSAEVNSSITLTWSSTLATSCSASGSWSGSKGTSGSESITIGVGGSNSFSLSCSATGANSGSASTSVNGLRYFNGKVFDGYIRGAEVFVDTNDNLTLDANEASVSTDNAGGFTKLLFGNGTLVAKGGFDLDTGAELSDLTLVHKLEGYAASKLVSPFTTLIAYMDDASDLNAALGIDPSIDLLTTDPIPNLGQGIYDQMYEKGNQLTVLAFTLQNHSDAVDGTSELYFQVIADHYSMTRDTARLVQTMAKGLWMGFFMPDGITRENDFKKRIESRIFHLNVLHFVKPIGQNKHPVASLFQCPDHLNGIRDQTRAVWRSFDIGLSHGIRQSLHLLKSRDS